VERGVGVEGHVRSIVFVGLREFVWRERRTLFLGDGFVRV
jgi:hypothetical protein